MAQVLQYHWRICHTRRVTNDGLQAGTLDRQLGERPVYLIRHPKLGDLRIDDERVHRLGHLHEGCLARELYDREPKLFGARHQACWQCGLVSASQLYDEPGNPGGFEVGHKRPQLGRRHLAARPPWTAGAHRHATGERYRAARRHGSTAPVVPGRRLQPPPVVCRGAAHRARAPARRSDTWSATVADASTPCKGDAPRRLAHPTHFLNRHSNASFGHDFVA